MPLAWRAQTRSGEHWARFGCRPVGYRAAVTHSLALDPGDFADRTDNTTEPHTPLRRTWILGWHQAGQLLLAYVLLTAVFAFVGWVAFGNQRHWWLTDLDLRISRW